MKEQIMANKLNKLRNEQVNERINELLLSKSMILLSFMIENVITKVCFKTLVT